MKKYLLVSLIFFSCHQKQEKNISSICIVDGDSFINKPAFLPPGKYASEQYVADSFFVIQFVRVDDFAKNENSSKIPQQ